MRVRSCASAAALIAVGKDRENPATAEATPALPALGEEQILALVLAPRQPGRRIEVRFLDDEVLLGSTLGYRPDGSGFFVTPADSEGNNLRIFVLPGGIRHVRYI